MVGECILPEAGRPAPDSFATSCRDSPGMLVESLKERRYENVAGWVRRAKRRAGILSDHRGTGSGTWKDQKRSIELRGHDERESKFRAVCHSVLVDGLISRASSGRGSGVIEIWDRVDISSHSCKTPRRPWRRRGRTLWDRLLGLP